MLSVAVEVEDNTALLILVVLDTASCWRHVMDLGRETLHKLLRLLGEVLLLLLENWLDIELLGTLNLR